MKRQPREKINIPMCIACVLLCLTLFSCHLCSGLYARYTTVATGSDGARVARFDVSEEEAHFDETLFMETVPGVTRRTFSVINNSEVKVAYRVTVENTTRNIPFAFSVNGSEPVEGLCSVVCELEPDSVNSITIDAIWSEEGALRYVGMVDLVKLSIRAEQMD